MVSYIHWNVVRLVDVGIYPSIPRVLFPLFHLSFMDVFMDLPWISWNRILGDPWFSSNHSVTCTHTTIHVLHVVGNVDTYMAFLKDSSFVRYVDGVAEGGGGNC